MLRVAITSACALSRRRSRSLPQLLWFATLYGRELRLRLLLPCLDGCPSPPWIEFLENGLDWWWPGWSGRLSNDLLPGNFQVLRKVTITTFRHLARARDGHLGVASQ